MYVYNHGSDNDGFIYSRKGMPEGDLEEIAERLKILGLLNLIEIDQVQIGNFEASALSAHLSYFGVAFFFATHDTSYRTIPSLRPNAFGHPDFQAFPATAEVYNSPAALLRLRVSKGFRSGLELNFSEHF